VISRFLEAPAYRTPRSISTLTGNKLSPPVHFYGFFMPARLSLLQTYGKFPQKKLWLDVLAAETRNGG
jgi:hypothetical protein